MVVRRIRPPCHTNMYERREIVQHFRDMANVGHLLELDAMEEIIGFKKKLHEFGWCDKEIDAMETAAYSRTIWEKNLPHTIRNRGNWFVYLKNKWRLDR